MNDLSGSNPAIINAVSQLRTVKSGKDVCDVQLVLIDSGVKPIALVHLVSE